MRVRAIQPADLDFIRQELRKHWGDTGIWSLGRRYQADQLPGFVAVDESSGNDRVGLVTYAIQDGGAECEIVTLSSRVEGCGVGAALLEAAVSAARRAGCTRAFLTTTNDNLRALGFYQRRHWALAAVHRNAMDTARIHNPAIPLIGLNGIPLRDEIELELRLDAVTSAARADTQP